MSLYVMATEIPRPKATMIHVHLADNEYSGHKRLPGGTLLAQDNMRIAAKEAFEAHPDVENMVVEVHEHGGWYLSFLRDGTCVGTANDMAKLSDAALKFWESVKDAKWSYLPSIRRPDLV